jgi:hypothetical protein
VLDGSGFLVSLNPAMPDSNQDQQAVAFNGTNYLVPWHDALGGVHDAYNDGGVRSARVSTSGSVLDAPVVVSDTCHPATGGWVTVASDGSNFLVVWPQDDAPVNGKYYGADIYARKISATGQPSGAPFPIIRDYGNQWWPQLAFGGHVYLAVWTEGGPSQGARETGVWGRLLQVP